MTDPSFSGDPGAMIRVGWRIRETATALSTGVSTRQGRLTMPAGTNNAWAHGPTATAATAGWQTYLTQVATRVDDLGAGLIATGREVQTTDHDNAKAM